MSNDKKDAVIFTPYYINQNRLFDLYSILNEGFIEYEEISSSSATNTKGTGKAEAAVSGGFKLIKISGGAEAGIERTSETTSGATMKKVQTVTSILSTVLTNMEEKNHFQVIENASEGDFVNVFVNFKLNSIKKLLELLKEIVGLSATLKTFGTDMKIPYNTKQIDDIIKMFKFLFGGLEVFDETDDYAIIANINEDNLYLSNIDDIIGTNIQCFAQVKKIHAEGATLLRNTMFSKMKGLDKSSLISNLANLANNDALELGVNACSEIVGKPVYEVEIISLCK